MFNPTHLFLVAIGGMIGSVLRYLVSVLIDSKVAPANIPWGTFTVNLIGSFIIGMVLAYALNKGQQANLQWQLFIATGICGGFTTFSALSKEAFVLLKNEQVALCCLYVFGTLALGIIATAAGYLLGGRLFPVIHPLN